MLDSEILADVYLVLTGGQTALSLDQETSSGSVVVNLADTLDVNQLRKVTASSDELLAHDLWLEKLRKAEDGCAWDKVVAH